MREHQALPKNAASRPVATTKQENVRAAINPLQSDIDYALNMQQLFGNAHTQALFGGHEHHEHQAHIHGDNDSEPENITNSVRHTMRKKQITVKAGTNETKITIKAKIERGVGLDQDNFDKSIIDIEREWNTSATIGGHRYTVVTKITKVDRSKNPLARGDLVIEPWFTVNKSYKNHNGLNQGKKIWINRGIKRRKGKVVQAARPTTPAHEFGHAIGLGHQKNDTKSIMSYARDGRSLKKGTDLKRLADAYQ